jgi:uncharacterized protein (TIGR01777 family)
MKIVVSGPSGLLGSALVPALRADGHVVSKLVRRPVASADELFWDPARRELHPAALASVDAVVHLAGAGVADKRWTRSYRRVIFDSRVDGTTTISHAIAAAEPRPRVLLSMSGSGYYGDTRGATVDESSPAGAGFLAGVVQAWEAATAEAAASGARVVHMRTSPVLTAAGGTLGRMLPLAKLSLLSPLGRGTQYVPWVSLADQLAIVRFLLTAESVSGPVNVTSPNPVTMAELTDTLLRVLGRRRLAPRVPAVALRLALGGFADEGVLTGQRALPHALEAAGYRFQHPTLAQALSWATGRPLPA